MSPLIINALNSKSDVTKSILNIRTGQAELTSGKPADNLPLTPEGVSGDNDMELNSILDVAGSQ